MRINVIGGGVAGLATAALAARDGHEVALFEQGDQVGGRAGSWHHDGFTFDTGPSWYLMPEVFEHYFNLLGTSVGEQLDLVRLDPGYRVYFEAGEPVTVAAERTANEAVFGLIEPGAGAELAKYLDSADKVYDLAVKSFLYSNFTSVKEFLRPEVLKAGPSMLPLLAQSLQRHIESRFSSPRLRQVLGYPAVFLGSSPDRIPALYHLMSRMDLGDGVLYPMGGFRTLIDALERLALEAGVRIHRNARVDRIETTRTSPARRNRLSAGPVAKVSGLSWTDTSAGGEERHHSRCDVVVASADMHHVEHDLLPVGLRSRSARTWRASDPGPGAVLVLLGVKGSLPELEHHTMFFTQDWESNFDAIFGDQPTVPAPASSYVCKPSATDPGVAPAGAENVFILVPVPADVTIGRGGVDGKGDPQVEEIADRAIAQLALWSGIDDLDERILVRRTVGPGDFARDYNAWSGGALGPGHTLRQSAFFRARNTSRKVDGLYYAGATTVPGIGLPMCLISAELVLKRLRGDTTAGPLPVPAEDTK